MPVLVHMALVLIVGSGLVVIGYTSALSSRMRGKRALKRARILHEQRWGK